MSALQDVHHVIGIELLGRMGVSDDHGMKRCRIEVDTSTIKDTSRSTSWLKTMRASILVLGPLF